MQAKVMLSEWHAPQHCPPSPPNMSDEQAAWTYPLVNGPTVGADVGATVGVGVSLGGAMTSTFATVPQPPVVHDAIFVMMPGPDTVTSYAVLACNRCASFCLSSTIPSAVAQSASSRVALLLVLCAGARAAEIRIFAREGYRDGPRDGCAPVRERSLLCRAKARFMEAAARRIGFERAALGWRLRLDPRRRATQIEEDDGAQADRRARNARERCPVAAPRECHLRARETG